MLRVAIPNKGMLSETSVEMLQQAGYATRRDTRELFLSDAKNGVEFFYLRPRDIATYVGSGSLDVGITGRDLLLDSHSSATEISDLHFGESTFRFAGTAGTFSDISQLNGLRVATSYPGLIEEYASHANLTFSIVRLDGAVESAIRLGVADAIADVVSTGTTMRNAGLAPFGDPILESSAVLIAAPHALASGELQDEALTLSRRLDGVQVGRRFVLVDYDAPVAVLEACCAITPGIESPTVSPLADPEWVAVRAMMPRIEANDIMDALYEVGARAILVSSITAARI